MQKKETPTISIIIPTFNRLEYTRKCLKSIKAQSNMFYEIIVIDDGSTENISPLKNDCDILIHNDINLGPAYARNLGALNSHGKILLFLDSDAELIPDNLARIEALFKKHPSIGVIGGSGPPNKTGNDVEYITGKSYTYFGRCERTNYYNHQTANAEECIYDCEHVQGAFLAVPRDLFEKIGGFDPYWFYMGEDRDFCLRIRLAGYRVVTAWAARTIHHSINAHHQKNPLATTKFLMKRYLQVAIKIDGILGGIRWIVGNGKDVLKFNNLINIFSLANEFRNYSKLANRNNLNFLSKEQMDAYYSSRLSLLTGKKLPFNVTSPINTPNNIILFVTLKCNASCDHCFIFNLPGHTKDDMRKEEIATIIDHLNRPTHIIVTGGEPFLRKDLEEILHLLMKSSHVTSVRVNSNGSFPKNIETIFDIVCKTYKKPLSLQLSIDGLGAHDKIRKISHGFDKVIESCNIAKSLQQKYSNFSFIVAVTIMRKNINEVVDIVDYLQQKKIPNKISVVRGNSFSTFDVPAEILDNAYNPQEDNLSVSVEEVTRTMNMITTKHPDYFNPYQKEKLKIMLNTLKFKKRQIPCYAGYDDAVIFSNGDIAICEQVKPFGNLSKWDWNIYDAWNSKEAWTHRHKLTHCSCIHGCNIGTAITKSAEKSKLSFRLRSAKYAHLKTSNLWKIMNLIKK